MKSTATRRLWARRAHRLVWGLGSLVEAIRKFMIAWMGIWLPPLITALLYFVIFHETRAATNESIAKAAKDPCVKKLLVQGATLKAITNWDVDWAIKACDGLREREKQMEILK